MKTIRDILADASKDSGTFESDFSSTIYAARKAFTNGEELRRQANTATRALILWLLDPSKPLDRGERFMLAELLAGETHPGRGGTSKNASAKKQDAAFLEEAKAEIARRVAPGLPYSQAEDEVCEEWAHRQGWTPETMKRYLGSAEKRLIRQRVKRYRKSN